MDNNQSIIIKRVKKVAGGHHGGAWKVAYADFVTAMMAFFLLLWLLNATEAENLAGLADYFAPTVGVKDEMGIGFRGGKAALSEGIGADKNTNKGIVFGGVPTGPITKVTTEILERTDQQSQEQIQVVINEAQTQKKGTEDQQEDKAASDNPVMPTQAQENQEEKLSEEMEKTQQALQSTVEDMVKDRRIDEGTIEIKRTPEGLMIEVKDISGNSMFEKDSPAMKTKLKEALGQLSKILKNVPNNYAVIGHTSSAPVESKKIGYSKWELSADRANSTRSYLEKNGVQAEQFSRIEGRADNVPFDVARPDNNVNNRIDIIILTKSDTPEHKKSAPNSLLMDIKASNTKKFIEDTEEKPKEEEKAAAPVKENTEAKKILEESYKIQSEAEKAKLPVQTEKPDIIDLKIEERKQAAPKAIDKGVNNEAAKIFEEAAKVKAAAPAQPGQASVPAKSADVIDLSVDRKIEEEKQEVAPENNNQQFQKMLNDIEELKKKRAPTPPPATGQ